MSSATTNNNRVGGGGGGFKTLLSPRRRTSFSKKKDEAENPYSALGREKFSALLADVEEKKRMILAEIGADEGDSDTQPLIRFVNSEKDGKLRPVVIRPNGTKNHNKGINRERVSMSMSMTATMTNPLKKGNLAEPEQIKEHQHQRLPEDEKEVEKEKEEEEDEGSDFVWFGNENVKQMKSPTQPPPAPKPEEVEVSRPCTKVCEEEETERRSANKCEVKLVATHNGLMNSLKKEVESSSSRSGNKLQLEASHVYVGVIVVMVLMLLLLFERYWRIYYLVEFQTKICLHEKLGN